MRLVATLMLVFVLQAADARGQTVLPACDGDITMVRLSTIKPTSSLQAFMKAQDAHLAWYRKNGFTTNHIYSARVLVVDKTAKQQHFSDTEVMTFHVRPPVATGAAPISAKDQAGWDNYVKMYRDSSDITSEHVICMPKHP